MNPSDYRRDYAEYHSAVERERFKLHAGLSSQSDLREIEERYAELWTRESIEDLRRACAETAGQFEAERAALRALEGAACLKHAEASAREATEELRHCSASSRVEWGGTKFSEDETRELVADERDEARRRELTRRLFDAVRACDDLRAARLDALDAATRVLGFDDRRALYLSFAGVDVERLAAEARAFLERTERVYMTRLAQWAALASPVGAGRGLDYAEQIFFRRATRFDA